MFRRNHNHGLTSYRLHQQQLHRYRNLSHRSNTRLNTNRHQVMRLRVMVMSLGTRFGILGSAPPKMMFSVDPAM